MGHEQHGAAPVSGSSVNRLALSATLHCLTGCGIGEILGLVLATALGWGNVPSLVLGIVLAFLFGYSLTLQPLLSGGLPIAQAMRLALASDTASLVVMESVDNAVVLAIPGAMDAGLADPLFWISLAASLAIAFAIT